MKKTEVRGQRSEVSKEDRGFSLAELLVAMAIFSLVAAAVVTTLLSAQQTWATGSGQAMVTAQLRRMMDRLSFELSQTRLSEIQRPAANGQPDTRIVFRIPQDRNQDGTVLNANGEIAEWSDWITYRGGLSGRRTAVFFRDLQPAGGGAPTSEIVATHVSSLSFSRSVATPDIIQVTVGNYAVTEKGEVAQRLMRHRFKVRN